MFSTQRMDRQPGQVASPASDAVIKMPAGRPASTSRGTKARRPLTTPPRLTCNTRSHSSGGASHIAPGDRLITPAFRQMTARQGSAQPVAPCRRRRRHWASIRPYPEFSRDVSEAL